MLSRAGKKGAKDWAERAAARAREEGDASLRLAQGSQRKEKSSCYSFASIGRARSQRPEAASKRERYYEDDV